MKLDDEKLAELEQWANRNYDGKTLALVEEVRRLREVCVSLVGQENHYQDHEAPALERENQRLRDALCEVSSLARVHGHPKRNDEAIIGIQRVIRKALGEGE